MEKLKKKKDNWKHQRKLRIDAQPYIRRDFYFLQALWDQTKNPSQWQHAPWHGPCSMELTSCRDMLNRERAALQEWHLHTGKLSNQVNRLSWYRQEKSWVWSEFWALLFLFLFCINFILCIREWNMTVLTVQEKERCMPHTQRSVGRV